MSAELPSGWILVQLQAIAKVTQGQSPPGSTYNSEGNGLPFFQGKAEFGDLYPTVAKWCSEPKRLSNPGDVLISIRAPVGPTNLTSTTCCIGRGLAAVTPLGGIPSQFYLYYLRHTVEELVRQGTGTTFKAISGGQLRSHSVLLPPLLENSRIVEAIESYLTRLDEAVATLERVQRNLKRYRASVLKAAVEGRLVPTEAELARRENREYEPASVLLERILRERKHRFIEDAAEKGRAKAEAKATSAGKTWTDADDEKTLMAERTKAAKKYQEPSAPNTSDLPDLPEGWCWVNAEMVYWDAGYGTSQKCTYDSEGPPVLRIPNVQGEALTLDDMKFATEANALKAEGTVQVADFLFIRTNGSQSLIGRGAAVLRQLPVEHHFASYLIRLRLVNVGEVPRWIMIAWHTQTVRKQLLKDAASSAGQHNVSLSAAKRYLIPLPPEREQPRILAELEKTRSIAAVSDGIVESQIDRSNRLRQSILKWAFEGKLVDQDPNDEPASVLLERIKAERSASQPTKKATRSRRKREAT